MTPSSEAAAAIALTVYLLGLGLALGARTWQQYRRTGDTGIRRIASDTSRAGRWGVVLFAAALLLGLLGPLLALIVPDSTSGPGTVAWWVGLGLALGGLALVVASQQAMGASWRIGVDPTEVTGLVSTGPFALVRNPIFSAMVLAVAGVALMAPNPASVAALVTLVIGIELQVRFVEEPYLLETHGQEFRAYASRAGRFLPGLGRIPRTPKGDDPT